MTLEQRAGLRKQGLGTLRSGTTSYDSSVRLKAVLTRRDIFVHLAKAYSHFEKEIMAFANDDWFKKLQPCDEEQRLGFGFWVLGFGFVGIEGFGFEFWANFVFVA